MSGAKQFGDNTSWGVWDHKAGSEGWSEPGWVMPSDHGRYISKHDPYWGRVLDHARQAYGDPSIHYSTDNVGDERHLVFGDGTRLPDNGTIVYHDSGSKQNWAQNDDGTVSLVGPDGKQGPPIPPAAYRKLGDQYAPVNANGQQIGPQLGGVPNSDNGFYNDPKSGLLTPKNSNGDYYTLGPDGTKTFFDKNGAPISEEQFNNASKPRDPTPHPGDNGLATDEQQSGKAADAVKKLQQELKNHYTKISDAEEKLSEVLLNAHATTSAGQQKLNDIQKKIVDAVNNPTMAMDTPAGERAFLTFLRNQVGATNDLLADGSLSAEDQSKAAQALAALYAADNGAGNTDDSPKAADPGGQSAPPASPPAPAEPDPAPAAGDPGSAGAPDMSDPGLSDMLGGGPLGSDPLSSLASMLPALGSLGGAGGSPLDSLGGLAGAASPLAGLASGLGDQGNHERPSDTADKPEDSPDHPKDSKDAKADSTTPPDGAQGAPGQQGPQAQNAGNSTPGDPPNPATPPAPPSPTVKLPDGSTATARSPQAAQAIRDYLAGKTVDAAYRQNNIQLPPPGTPVTNPMDPSRLTCGDLAMFKDHYVPVLSSVKAYVNGQVVPLESVSSSPDFLGWIDPTAAATSTGPHSGPPAAPQPQPAIPPVASAPPASSAPALAAAAPAGG
ncbi:DUF4226 domain-containing protein (plasmid) [Mycobacterium sp. Aquia_216]|uniref:DUF4226 domain-containing protein n=1 Tax=Mycobacterium sp. Aquia_216 TaxID=2991729 RepID=UPI002279FE8A|nr:DUF4226 domain-containing protein [Mycobacterium sp. Aquia_216]WAJ48021.1 DUF4226 domain-containing protein [Mycobacterium sp. Aquia_216]